jgi:hypothetical protein
MSQSLAWATGLAGVTKKLEGGTDAAEESSDVRALKSETAPPVIDREGPSVATDSALVTPAFLPSTIAPDQ